MAPKEEHQGVINWTEHIISQMILNANKDERIILCGDFNQKLSKFKEMAKKYNLD